MVIASCGWNTGQDLVDERWESRDNKHSRFVSWTRRWEGATVRESWPDHRRKVSAEGSSSTSARCSDPRASPRLRRERKKKKRPRKNVTRSRCVGSRQQSQGAVSSVWKWSNNNNNLSRRLKKHFGRNQRDVQPSLQEPLAHWVLNGLTLESTHWAIIQR